MKKILIIGTMSLLQLAHTTALGKEQTKDADLDHIETVLDQLERKLIDDQADGLTFSEKAAAKEKPAKTSATMTMKKERVEATTGEAKRLAEINQLLKDLEQRVDQFAGKVQVTKQQVIDASNLNHMINIDAMIDQTDAMAIKNLAIRIDGQVVYDLKDTSGVWMPKKALPLYAGPLEPGTHRIDVEARLIMKSKDALPLNTDVYKFVNQSFDLPIATDDKIGRYAIVLSPPTEATGQPKAELKDIK
jgi:hypothetical protein